MIGYVRCCWSSQHICLVLYIFRFERVRRLYPSSRRRLHQQPVGVPGLEPCVRGVLLSRFFCAPLRLVLQSAAMGSMWLCWYVWGLPPVVFRMSRSWCRSWQILPIRRSLIFPVGFLHAPYQCGLDGIAWSFVRIAIYVEVDHALAACYVCGYPD